MDLRQLNDDDLAKLKELQFVLWSNNCEFFPTGSREIGGYTEESDYDFVTKASAEILRAYNYNDHLIELGFERTNDTDQYSGSDMATYRYGKLNIILAYSKRQLDYWKKATLVAKLLKPDSKESRVAIFETIRDGGTTSIRREEPVAQWGTLSSLSLEDTSF